MAKKDKDFTYEYNPIKEQVGGKEAERVIWTTKALNMAVDAISQGLPLKSNPFCGKNTKLLRPDLVYRRTEEEIADYLRCKEDPVYFGEKCFLMTPEGLKQCKLRDYQQEYLYHLKDHPYSVYLAARQVGKCSTLLMVLNIYIQKDKLSVKKYKYLSKYRIKENIYRLPLFELWDIYKPKTKYWKIEYFIYKKLLKLNNKTIQNLLYRILGYLNNKEFFSHVSRDNQVIYNIPLPEGIRVETDTGYQPVTNLIYKIPFQVYRITLSNGYILEGADKHIVYKGKTKNGMVECYIDELRTKDFIYTDKGFKRVKKIEKLPYKLCMGDISVNHPNHRFYSNGILSHNSVTTGIYVLWKTIFNVDNNALILSKSGQAGVDLVKKIKDMYLYLPYHLKCGTIKWNQSEVSLDNNSSFRTEAFGPTAGVGSTINTLVLDEFAWCPPNDVELFYENVIPTVTTMPNSNVCIMSTQNGFNKFYQIYQGAITGKNIYAPYRTDWYQVPNFDPETRTWVPRTEEWKDMMVGVLGSEEAFYYQYGTQFLSSDKCLVSREKMATIKNDMRLFKSRGDELDNLTMLNPENLYWDPEFDLEELKKGYFILCIDLAEGGGNDYTCFQIIQVIAKDKFKQVGRYYTNKIPIQNVALDLWLMCPQIFTEEHYIISIELNTYGVLFYNELMLLNDDGYRPEYNMRFKFVEEFDSTNIIYYKKGNNDESNLKGFSNSSGMLPGVKITHNSKITGCTLLKMMIERDELIVYDTVTVCEFENFEDKNGNGSYAASYGHDDTVMPFVQLPLMKNTPRYKNFMEEYEINNVAEGMGQNLGGDMYGLPETGPFGNPMGSDTIFG